MGFYVPNNRVLGFQNDTINCIRALKPHYLGAWTLRVPEDLIVRQVLLGQPPVHGHELLRLLRALLHARQPRPRSLASSGTSQPSSGPIQSRTEAPPGRWHGRHLTTTPVLGGNILISTWTPKVSKMTAQKT